MNAQITNINKMNLNEVGTVKDILGGNGIKNKLESLGIVEGAKVRKKSSFFSKGPIIIEIGMTQIALGHGMTEKIIVEVEKQ